MATGQQWMYVVRPTRPEMLVSGPTEAEAATISGHVAYAAKLADEGTLILMGRTQTDTPDTFGIAVFFAESEELARAIMENDPAVVGGVMRAELFPYRVAFGNKATFGAALDATDES